MAPDSSREAPLSSSGMGFATACYLAWGLVPIYWKSIAGIPSDEALIPRILWTLVLLIGTATVTGKRDELRPAQAREWGWNLLSALLLSTNWLIFIYAVQSGQIVATSLGYYIRPSPSQSPPSASPHSRSAPVDCPGFPSLSPARSRSTD